LEVELDREIGEMLQIVLFTALLRERQAFVRFCSEGGPSYGAAVLTTLWPLMKIGTIQRYGITPETSQDAQERFAAAIARLDDRVATRRYLVGDRFSRVDITAAALLCPIVRPPGYDLGTEVPTPLRPFAQRFDGTPTWRWVHRMYAEERHLGEPD
jgi:glutathione S-transferase